MNDARWKLTKETIKHEKHFKIALFKANFVAETIRKHKPIEHLIIEYLRYTGCSEK